MHMRATKEEVLELIAEKKDILTICEGKKDVLALKNLGFTVRELGGPIYKVVESVEKGECIQLLVDLDGHGKELYARLQHEYRQRGVYIDNELREMLFTTGVQQIEHLDSFFKE
jgi:5S rRNA maturation endonuclease (ribonuclease M5)